MTRKDSISRVAYAAMMAVVVVVALYLWDMTAPTRDRSLVAYLIPAGAAFIGFLLPYTSRAMRRMERDKTEAEDRKRRLESLAAERERVVAEAKSKIQGA